MGDNGGMTLTIESRVLELEVAHNVRHLGGYTTSNGRTTNPRIIRSAGLHRLTPNGIAVLAERGVTNVVDLRSKAEREREQTPSLHHVGITSITAAVFDIDASPEGLGKEFAGYAPVYRSMLQTGRPAYRTLFETIATAQGGVLFHCSAGKDRTGIASALLLGLAGVPDEVIVQDYSLSEALLSPLLPEWLPRIQERGLTETQARGMLASRPDAMEHTLIHIADEWGGPEGYMRDIGMAPSLIDELRARLAD